jgi:hypothetical protein
MGLAQQSQNLTLDGRIIWLPNIQISRSFYNCLKRNYSVWACLSVL